MSRPWFLAVFILGSSSAFADSAADVWNAKCKACHAADGTGKTKVGTKEKVADLSAPDWQAKKSDAEIRTVIADGSTKNDKMKAFKEKLTAAEIDSLVAHIRSLKK
jgi:mono/diheme cytochrome c family protein